MLSGEKGYIPPQNGNTGEIHALATLIQYGARCSGQENEVREGS